MILVYENETPPRLAGVFRTMVLVLALRVVGQLNDSVTMLVAHRHRLVGGCVLVDDHVCDDGTAGNSDDHQQHDKHQLRGVLVLAHTPEEAFDHLVESTSVGLHSVVGVVDVGEGVVPRDAHRADGPLAVGVCPRVEHDGVAGEQHRWHQKHVAGVEVQIQVFGVEPTTGTGHQAEHDHDAPGEAHGRHDGSAPRHETAPAACVLGLHPALADLNRIEDRNPQVQEPDECQNEVHQCLL